MLRSDAPLPVQVAWHRGIAVGLRQIGDRGAERIGIRLVLCLTSPLLGAILAFVRA